jgi:hypothetical protein
MPENRAMSDGDHRAELPVRPIEGDDAFDRCALRRRCGRRRRCPKDTGEIVADYACTTGLSKSSIDPAEHWKTAITQVPRTGTARSRRQRPTYEQTQDTDTRSGVDGGEHSAMLEA